MGNKKKSFIGSVFTAAFFFCCFLPAMLSAVTGMLSGSGDESPGTVSNTVTIAQDSTRASDPGSVGARLPAVPVPSVDFTIEEDASGPGDKRSVTVRLPRKVDEASLREIATYIESKDSGARPTFIVYLLPGQLDGAGAWATSHFNPDLDVQILGSSASAEKSQKPKKGAGQVVGEWNDHRMSMGKVIIYEKGGEYSVETYFADGSGPLVQELEKRGASTYWVQGSSTKDRYKISANGDMEIHDMDGLIATCPRAD